MCDYLLYLFIGFCGSLKALKDTQPCHGDYYFSLGL